MPSHRRQDRRSPAEVPAEGSPPESGVARFESVQEDMSIEADRLPQPAGFGLEASRSAQSKATLAEYVVPGNTIARVREVSLSLESNSEALVSIGGIRYGPYTGATDISLPLDPGVLLPGDRIEVKHQSTDGNSQTTKASAVVLEV